MPSRGPTGVVDTKRCPKCGETKPVSEFYKDRFKKDGLQSHCKVCLLAYRKTEAGRAAKRASDRKRKYGITPEQFDQMLADQGGRCSICNTDTPGGHGWHVDHDHDSGKVRGILCTHCNRALGGFRDSPAILQSALAYLRHHE